MAAFGRIEVERRGGPALRLENRSEQEWAEAHPDIGFLRQRSDPPWRRDRNRSKQNRTRNRARGEASSHASRPGRNGKRGSIASGFAPGELPDLRRRAEMICQGGARAMSNFTLRDLEKRVQERAKASAHTSYTRRLLDQGVAHCAKKLGEEAIETVLAAVEEDR